MGELSECFNAVGLNGLTTF